jgi:uncharacterized membrane protein
MNWHPMVVHFPLVLLPLSFGVDLAGWIGKRPDWHRGAYYLLVLGVLSAVAAVFTGNEAALSYRGEVKVLEHIEEHEDLATLVLFVFLVVALGRLPLQLQGRLQGWALKSWILAAGVGCALLWQTGFYGGELVYVYGVGVR